MNKFYVFQNGLNFLKIGLDVGIVHKNLSGYYRSDPNNINFIAAYRNIEEDLRKYSIGLYYIDKKTQTIQLKIFKENEHLFNDIIVIATCYNLKNLKTYNINELKVDVFS